MAPNANPPVMLTNNACATATVLMDGYPANDAINIDSPNARSIAVMIRVNPARNFPNLLLNAFLM